MRIGVDGRSNNLQGGPHRQTEAKVSRFPFFSERKSWLCKLVWLEFATAEIQ